MSIGENYLEIVERKNRAAVRSGRNPEDVLLLAVTKRQGQRTPARIGFRNSWRSTTARQSRCAGT